MILSRPRGLLREDLVDFLVVCFVIMSWFLTRVWVKRYCAGKAGKAGEVGEVGHIGVLG